MSKKKSELILLVMKVFIVVGTILLLVDLYTFVRMFFQDASFYEPKLPRDAIVQVTGASLKNLLIVTGITGAKTAAILERFLYLMQKMIGVVILILTYRLLQGVLHEESPFRSVRARKIGNLALLYLTIPVLQTIVCLGISMALNEGYTFSWLLLFMQLSGLVTPLLVCCLILGVAKAFQYGSVLQEELDETL